MEPLTCKVCGETKPPEAFPPYQGRICGRRNYCRACKAAAEADPAYRAARNAKRRARYAASPAFRAKRIAQHRAYIAVSREQHRAARQAYWQRYKAANRDKLHARRAVNKAVVRGKLLPAAALKCVRCGQQASDYHHHLGYSQAHRMDVVPVCRACHGVEHRKAS